MKTLSPPLLLLALLATAPCGCLSHKVNVDPIEVKPIHVTVDVNVKVQRELDRFFEGDEEVTTPATTDRKD